MIALDSVLIKCIKTDDIYLSHRDLIDGIIAGKSLSAHHTITFADLGAEKRTVSHKGAVVPILVSVRNRGSKVTTLISNLDRFEIDAKLFSQEYGSGFILILGARLNWRVRLVSLRNMVNPLL
jgi:hypothetical protein